MIPIGFFALLAQVDEDEFRRELRMRTAIAHDFTGDLNADGRSTVALSGTTSYTTGPDGAQALASSGSSANFVQTDLRGLNAIDGRQRFAFEALVRPTANRRFSSTSYIFSVFQSGTERIRISCPQQPTGADPVGFDFVVGSQTLSTSEVYAANAWHHLVCEADGAELRIWVNNALVASAALTAGTLGTPDRWGLGQCAGAVHTELGFDFQYVRLYHDALSADLIDYLYNGGDSRPAADWMTVAYGTTPDAYAESLGLHRYYRLDETSGTNANDTGSDGSDGTLTNGAAFSNAVAPPAGWANTDYSVNLDGSNDFVDLPDITNAGADFSVFGWARADTISTFHVLFNASDAGYANLIYLDVNNGTTSLRFALADGSSNFGTIPASPVGSFTATTWNHAAAVVDADGASVMMINGIVRAFRPEGTPVIQNDTRSECFLGKSAGGPHPFDGQLKAWGINRSARLTCSQIAKLYDLGNGSG